MNDDVLVSVSQDSFELKLVNKHKVHGIASALMAYNPIRAKGKIQEYGYGSRVDLHITGKLNVIELAICIVYCSAMGFLVTAISGTHDMFHFLGGMCIVLLLPLLYMDERKRQDRKLRQFITTHLQPLIVEEKTIL